MSIKSTHKVTREFALAAIGMKLYQMNDEQLGDILETVIHNGFYNFFVMSQFEFDKDEESDYPTPSLTDLSNLPEYNDAH